MRVEFFDHTGDIGVRLRAPSLEQLFAAAAEALVHSMCDPTGIAAHRQQSIALVAPAVDMLLVDWLNELLYRFETERLLARSAEVTLARQSGQHQMTATVVGESYDPARHHLKTLIKAVTYHQLAVTQTASEWQATVVFDV